MHCILNSLHCISWIPCLVSHEFHAFYSWCALYNMHDILCIVFCALYYMHCILCIVLFVLYSRHCMPSIEWHALHAMHCMLRLFYLLYYFKISEGWEFGGTDTIKVLLQSFFADIIILCQLMSSCCYIPFTISICHLYSTAWNGYCKTFKLFDDWVTYFNIYSKVPHPLLSPHWPDLLLNKEI